MEKGNLATGTGGWRARERYLPHRPSAVKQKETRTAVKEPPVLCVNPPNGPLQKPCEGEDSA